MYCLNVYVMYSFLTVCSMYVFNCLRYVWFSNCIMCGLITVYVMYCWLTYYVMHGLLIVYIMYELITVYVMNGLFFSTDMHF